VREWTIDTWVLYKVDEGDFDALDFLLAVLRHHRVVFDYERHIEQEYQRCLKRTRNRYLEEWFKRLIARQARVFYSGGLPSRHKQALLRMKFDRSDLPFVAVAFRSKDKLLVSEDSDYTQHVCGYLQQQLRVKVLSLSQALKLAEDTQDP
jgi:predicted nucleic acid-binding protein